MGVFLRVSVLQKFINRLALAAGNDNINADVNLPSGRKFLNAIIGNDIDVYQL